MKCKYCDSTLCTKKGIRNNKQRYLCKSCKKSFQDDYTYTLFDAKNDEELIFLNGEGMSISSMSRKYKCSKQSIIRRIIKLANSIKAPIRNEINQVYELDEMCTYIKRNNKSCYSWITYAINRATLEVVDVVVGRRNQETISKLTNKLISKHPKKVITDRCNVYPRLLKSVNHDIGRYHNNKIERCNLTVRNDVKRLGRKTICYSKSEKVLKAVILLYFHYKNWTFSKS